MRAEPLQPFSAERPAVEPSTSSLKDFWSLVKPRLSSLVLLTTAGGMWLTRVELGWQRWLFVLLGTAGVVGAANTLNCIIERRSDRFMARTAMRPLAKERLSVQAAMLFASVLALSSFPLLSIYANPLTAGLGLVALTSYAFLYTPLKSRSHVAMYVGALPGALPPLMGWTAATNSIDAGGLALFAVLAVWQLPHFIAIALFRKNEYLAAGLTSLPIEKGDARSRWHAVAWLVLLVPVGALPFVAGLGHRLGAVAAVALGVWLLLVAMRTWKLEAAHWGQRVFRASLVYLSGLMLVVVASTL